MRLSTSLIFLILSLICCLSECKFTRSKQIEDLPPLADGDSSELNEADRWEVCSKSDNLACTCESKVLKCDKVSADDELLETAEIYIKKKGFIPETVKLINNPITTLIKGKVIPEHESHIKVLDLTHNNIKNMSSAVFEDFINLHTLIFDRNFLTKIEKSWFIGIEDELEKLSLAENALTTIKPGVFMGLRNLKKLILDGNKIKFTKDIFKGLDKLEELSLDDCDIKDINDDLFVHLKSLKTLSLRNNPLVEIPKAVSELSFLTNIDMSGTFLTEIHSKTFEHTPKVNLIYMDEMPNLYSIQDCAFCGLTDLQTLSIKNNSKLYNLHGNAFGNLMEATGKVTSLKSFYLDDCNITQLDENLIPWDKLTDLTMHGNKVNCTCSMAFLADEEYVSFQDIDSTPLCGYPEELKGNSIIKMREEHICTRLQGGKSHKSGVRSSNVPIFFMSIMLVFTLGFLGMYMFRDRVRLLLNPSPQQFQMPFSYQNLNHADDQRELEMDFHPRVDPANV